MINKFESSNIPQSKSGEENPIERKPSPEEIREKLKDPNFLPRRDEITRAFYGSKNRYDWFKYYNDEKNPVYEVLNQEHISALADYFVDRVKNRTKDKPLIVLEVAAGNGRLSHMLRRKVDELGYENIKIIATDSYDPRFEMQRHFSVEKLDHKDAIKKYNPEVVLCSWMPNGEDLSKDFRTNESVKEYILIGEQELCGNADTWGNEWDEEGSEYRKDEFVKNELEDMSRLQSCRTDSPPEYYHSKTFSFRKEGWKEEQLDQDGFYLVKNEGAGIEFFGSEHTNDSESKTVRRLAEELEAYLKETPKHETILMIEGMYGGITLEKTKELLADIRSQEEAVKRFGENGVAIWVANKKRIEITSPEKSEDLIVEDLLDEGILPPDIAAYLTARQLISEITRPSDPEISKEDLLQQFAKQFVSIDVLAKSGWVKEKKTNEEISDMLETNQESLRKYQEKVVKEFVDEFNNHCKISGAKADIIPSIDALIDRDQSKLSMSDINMFSDPNHKIQQENSINKVAKLWNEERDYFLFYEIENAVNSGKKPFIIFGGSHAIALEKKIKEILIHRLK